jgi:hypothetical protein
MGAEHWVVKNQNGEEWGLIKRLIIESATKQISYADVILMETGRLIRISWDTLLVQTGGIMLNTAEADIKPRSVAPPGARSTEAVTMEVWS